MWRMSFSATVEQMRAGTKTVTRREPNTWRNLDPFDRVLAVEKAMGLRAGEKQVPIGVIEIVSNRIVPFGDIDEADARREGFDGLREFFAVWRAIHGPWRSLSFPVRRIEFRHVPDVEVEEVPHGSV